MMTPRHPNRNSCACHDTGSNRVGKSRGPESIKVQSSIASAAQSAPNKKNGLNPCEKKCRTIGAFARWWSWSLSYGKARCLKYVALAVAGKPHSDSAVRESKAVAARMFINARFKKACDCPCAHQVFDGFGGEVQVLRKVCGLNDRFVLAKVDFHGSDSSIKVRMWRANTHVAGTPIIAPSTIGHPLDITGKPTQDPIREAKKTFIAIAPAPKG